mmetsp:Transcript_115369/g.288311  ORF Transcript_115369/g.288311 Transcript_115369/m.288311 type:complete len:246 (-) Transcript_115369:51-788(-)
MFTKNDTTYSEGANCCGTHSDFRPRGPSLLPLHNILNTFALLGHGHCHLRAWPGAWWHSNLYLLARIVRILDVDGGSAAGRNGDDNHRTRRKHWALWSSHTIRSSYFPLFARLHIPLRPSLEVVLIPLATQSKADIRLAHEEGTFQDGVLFLAVVFPLSLELDLEVVLHERIHFLLPGLGIFPRLSGSLARALGFAFALALALALAANGNCQGRSGRIRQPLVRIRGWLRGRSLLWHRGTATHGW